MCIIIRHDCEALEVLKFGFLSQARQKDKIFIFLIKFSISKYFIFNWNNKVKRNHFIVIRIPR